ncbi:hypothetical protein MPTK1_1g05380 [Marchantia polymorpha subsp. ruderalis]|uniref:Uncharacterized protein n=2 Tax=Marchantia polymorpha TaxID=3197 RepID=A0AAF6ALS5_MARPO|nr:hypothetical protein MARPO_0005s0070 [Marchantia polymorpha]BBM97395.1 hypothetical protein Mp_1g05380 [Marchantia polymorpha subsp. ruderalis]|eukprot:PTQ48411.1 hypothetical protein MARPO_0005s0070 [Marchantia polymorpha]
MGKQGADLKCWSSASSTDLVDPAAYFESWKREIQGKDGIPPDHRRLIFDYRVATQSLFYTCQRSKKSPKAREGPAPDIISELRKWHARLRSNNHDIAKLIDPKVAAEDEKVASNLYCETARELRDTGIPCNVYYLFFDRWVLAASLKGDIDIQIDKDFQSKRFEILLLGQLNGKEFFAPFVYRVNGSEVAAQMSMYDQTAKYRQGHQMRRLGLSTQSVEKGVEGREFNAPVEIGRSLTGCHGSELHDNQYIRCGKGSEVTIIVPNKDPPRQVKYFVLAVIQVPPVGSPSRLEQVAPHIPRVQSTFEETRGIGKAGLKPDSNGFNLSSCTTTSSNGEMFSHKHRTVMESMPVTSCNLGGNVSTSIIDSERKVSLSPEAALPSQGSPTERSAGEGNVEEMECDLREIRVDSSQTVDEPAGKSAKKKKKRKGRRSGRNTVDGNIVTIQGGESMPAVGGGGVPFDTKTVVTKGSKVHACNHGISEGSVDKRPSHQRVTHSVTDTKETDRQECVSGRQGGPGEMPSHRPPCGHCADGVASVNVSEALEDGFETLIPECSDGPMEGSSKQIGSSFRSEPPERLDMLFNSTEIGEEQVPYAEYVSRMDKDGLCLARPSTECGMSGDFRDPCALNASPDHGYMSTSNGFSQKFSISQPSEHIIDVVDFVSVDGVLEDPTISICKYGGSHFPLRELAGNLESLSDPQEQFSYSDSKVSARGGYNSGGTGGRNGRGGAEGSSNRGYGRGSDERRGTSGYHGESGQGSGGSGQGAGPGSSGTSGSGGGGGSGGGNGNRGGGGNSGGGWDGRPAENDGGNGRKEGDSDERHRHRFQAGSNGEITSESVQRKKGASSLDSRSARKVTIGAGDQLPNGISSNHGALATSSGGGKENNHTFWQKVQKSVEGEESVELEQLAESFGTHRNHRRTGSDEVNSNNRAEYKARVSSVHVNGSMSHESPHDRESNLDCDSFEQGVMTQDTFLKVGKSSNGDLSLDHTDLSNSNFSRRARDVLASAGAHGPESSKGAWQKKISWDEQRLTSQKILSEASQQAGSSKGQHCVKQATRNGMYSRGQNPDQQMISHTRSYSAPSTPHVFEENYTDSGEFNQYKSMKSMQVGVQQSTRSGSVGQIEQVVPQISLRPQTSNSSTVGQLGEARPGADELAQRLTSWKGRKSNGDQERSAPREKTLGDRERTIHCAQKWVPVEHKTGGVVKGSNGQVKTSSSLSAPIPVTTSNRETKENYAESASCKKSGISEEESRADGVPCSLSPSKSSRRLHQSLSTKKSSVVEQVPEPKESAVSSEASCSHGELANLRSLLPREKIADTLATLMDSEAGGQQNSVVPKPEVVKVSVSGERKSYAKRDPTARRDSSAVVAVRSEPSPAEKETRRVVRSVLDAVQISCSQRQVSDGVAGMLGSPLAEFEKVLRAVAPSFIPVSGTNCNRRGVQEKGSPCGSSCEGVQRSMEACLTEAHEDNTTCSRCRYAGTSMNSLWQWYEEPSYYGVEVRDLDPQRGLRDGGEQEQFLAYFVPYLSGIQLFGYSSQSDNLSKDLNGCARTSLKLDSVPSCQPKPFPGNDVLATLFPSEGRADESIYHQRPEGSVTEQANGPFTDMSAKDAHNLDARLLFEFFEADQPQVRQPLFPKVKDLLKGVNSLNSHSVGDPTALDDLCLGDLHPASWYAVAWYPIYRIPEGPLRAVFLTYHSFNHLTPTASSFGPMGGGCEELNDDAVSLPVVGLECYNLQAEPWLLLRSHCKEANKNMDRLPIGNLAQCLDDRIRSLKVVASLMARGIPHDVVSRSTDSSFSSSGSASKFKHCDYEFFLKRRR